VLFWPYPSALQSCIYQQCNNTQNRIYLLNNLILIYTDN
jgi:hypothetical protein